MKQNKHSKFIGFNPEVFDFFSQLKANNTREWFAEHRSFYDVHIKDSSVNFVLEMQERFSKLNLPYYADPKKSLFRINRDTRFSPNKDPYKSNLGVYFPYSIAESGKKPVHSLGIYFHIEPGVAFIAGGIHMPEPAVLKTIRARLADDYDILLKISKSKTLLNEFPNVLTGDTLKRAPQGYPQDHPALELLKLKEYTIYCDIDFNLVSTSEIADILERKSIAAIPFMEFFHNSF